MAITTYGELQAAIAAWLARTDLTDRILDFIALGEQRLFYGSADPLYPSPPLRLRAMEATTDPAVVKTQPGIAALALPPGFLAARAVALATNPPTDLDFATRKQMNALAGAGTAGRPRVFGFEGDTIRFGPVPDAAYGVLLSHWRRFDPLATTPTNWLLANAPGAYLYAALLEAQPFLLADQRLPLFAAQLAAATRALMAADEADRFGGQMILRADHGNP